MGYSLEEFYDDYIKNCNGLSELANSISNCPRENYLYNFVEFLLYRGCASDELFILEEELLNILGKNGDNCMIIKENGRISIHGNCPKSIEIKVKNSEQERTN